MAVEEIGKKRKACPQVYICVLSIWSSKCFFLLFPSFLFPLYRKCTWIRGFLDSWSKMLIFDFFFFVVEW